MPNVLAQRNSASLCQCCAKCCGRYQIGPTFLAINLGQPRCWLVFRGREVGLLFGSADFTHGILSLSQVNKTNCWCNCDLLFVSCQRVRSTYHVWQEFRLELCSLQGYIYIYIYILGTMSETKSDLFHLQNHCHESSHSFVDAHALTICQAMVALGPCYQEISANLSQSSGVLD